MPSETKDTVGKLRVTEGTKGTASEPKIAKTEKGNKVRMKKRVAGFVCTRN